MPWGLADPPAARIAPESDERVRVTLLSRRFLMGRGLLIEMAGHYDSALLLIDRV